MYLVYLSSTAWLPRWCQGSRLSQPNIKMQVRSLGEEDPLEEGMVLQSSCLENPRGQRSLAGYSP